MVNNANKPSINVVTSEGVLTNMSTLERRRLLFKAVGKGAAVGAVLSNPLISMAGEGGTVLTCSHPTTGQLIMCSVSGMQSAIGSRHLNTASAGGRSHGRWGQFAPGNACENIGINGTTAWNPVMKNAFPSSLSNWSWKTPVKTVLTFSSIPEGVTLAMLMLNGNKCNIPGGSSQASFTDYSSYEEVHWICAILNAAVVYPTRFPYSAEKIRLVANSTDNQTYRDNFYNLVKSLEGKYEF